METVSRFATLDDLEILIQLRFDYLFEDQPMITSDEKDRLGLVLHQYLIKHLNTDFFAAMVHVDNQIASVAFLCIFERPVNFSWPTGKMGTIYNVFTFPEFRRRGFATKTIEMLIDMGKQYNLSFIDLSASVSGKPLYLQLGFNDVDRTQSRYTEMRLSVHE